MQQARSAGADVLVTTEKDWVKVEPLWASVASALPLWRVDVEVRFLRDGASTLEVLVDAVLAKTSN
jgi:tetraacyldisaccharide-1-P 4'-kinase